MNQTPIGPMPPHVPAFVELGAHTYFGGQVQFNGWIPGEKIVIGKYCSIAHNAEFTVGGNHNTAAVSTYPFDNLFFGKENPTRSYRTTRPTIVGHDVWVGTGAYIGGGVNIGHGAVIGARAVISKDVPPYAIFAGNPGRAVRFRFNPKQIDQLLNLCWWDWPDQKVIENVDWFFRPIDEFLDHFAPV